MNNYEIVAIEYSGAFEVRRKSDGKVLLLTQYVSLDTLVRLAAEDLTDD